MDVDVASLDSPASSRAAVVRSCTTCAKAKTRCVKANGSRVCDRCARLNKECFFKEPVVKRKKVVKSTRAAQFEQLENKIEHLVNALSASQNRPPGVYPEQLSPPISQPDTNPPSGTRQYEVLKSLCEGDHSTPREDGNERPIVFRQPTDPQPSCTARPASSVHQAENQGLGVSLGEAETLLQRYCRSMSPAFPFVVLPSEVSAAQLYNEKPFLLRAIVTVACMHDLTKQQALLKHCMRELSERVLVNNEKSLGLIEAMLVLISWFHPHCFSSGQLTNLLSLANAMCTDLGLDRSPSHCAGFKTSTTRAIDGHIPPPRQHTLEEHRIFAGVWYVTSMFAIAFVKFRTLPFTKYLDECIDRLHTAREYESDALLVQTIRLQHLIEDVHASAPMVPSRMYIKAFETSLAQIREQDQSKEENVLLQLHYLKVHIHLWELCLNEIIDKRTQPLQHYIEGLCNLAEAVKQVLDIFFTIPISRYLELPFSVFNHFAHAFINLTKVASLEVDGWDPHSIDHIIDFPATINKVISNFESAVGPTSDGVVVENDTFKVWAAKVRWMKQVYTSKFGPDSPASSRHKGLGTWTDPCQVMQQLQPEATPLHQQPTPPDEYLSGDFFSTWDDAFWSTFTLELDMDVQKYIGPEPV